MKQQPEMMKAQYNMRPGGITIQGFLGSDSRDIIQIIDEDNSVIEELHISCTQIADKMEYFREKGKRGLGEFIEVYPHFAVKVDSVRGKLRCPFEDPGLIPKTNITVKNLEKNSEITYTDMNIHCIRKHGFFEGKGSFFRISPEFIIDALEILPLNE